jgi:transcriptional regulator with XRE-family HTH domain
MSYQPSGGMIPAWTLADRMRKSREHARLSQADLASDIGISRASVVNYESGRYPPSRPVMLSWALRTGVDLRWLRGDPNPAPPAEAVITHMYRRPRIKRDTRRALCLAAA